MNKVICVIPTYNSASTLERAVRSAYNAGCYAAYVYDDASTDNTQDVLKSLANTYNTLQYFRENNVRMGVNHARNFIIDRAGWHLFIPLDADDTLNDITPLRDAWQPNTWVYGNHCERREDSITLVAGCPAGSLPRKNITGVTFMFHRDDWQKVGGYDPDFAFAEDYAFQCALTNAGVKPVYVDTIVYDRFLKSEGNERSALANEYWTFYHTMARKKYRNLFSGTG